MTPRSFKNILALAAILAAGAPLAAQPNQDGRIQITKLHGQAQIHAQDASYSLKQGDALPAVHGSSASVVVLSGGFELMAGKEFHIRSGAGASYLVQEKAGEMLLQTNDSSTPVQLSDDTGNVVIVTAGTSLTAKRSKKSSAYSVAAGKALLTATDGNTYILKEKDRRTVDAAKMSAPKQTEQAAAPDMEEAQQQEKTPSIAQETTHGTITGN